jgi:phage terminase small subunit
VALSEKQKEFCHQYLIDLNASAAYKRAGYKAVGNAAETNAARMLRNAQVQAYIQHLMSQRSLRTQITADRVLEEVARIAFACITDVTSFGREGVTLRESSELSKDVVAAIAEVAEINLGKGGTKLQVKMHDKRGALHDLMRHLGLGSDFNIAIATLRNKYGIRLYQDGQGRWQVEDLTQKDKDD